MKNNPLPLVLCGPILRRTDSKNVTIWIALSQAIKKIKTNIYSSENMDTSIGISEQSTLQFGKNFHIALINVKPVENEFPKDQILCYNISLNGANIQSMLGKSIVYEPFSLPSFFIQSKETPLNLLFGSCRKMHGPDYDCLSRGDDTTSIHAKDISQRPSALFLGGDQIYADDVSSGIMPIIMELGRVMVGDESLMNVNTDAPYKFGSRGYLMKGFGLENLSYYPDNHLMKFGEFVAMYCMAWNPDVWPSDFPSEQQTRPKVEDFICEGEHSKSKTVKKRIERHQKEIKLLKQFRSSLPKVRRLLANIPTYMIFDDHEITDDWNITQSWKEKVTSQDLGVQVLSNGIAAYWLFQAWGNDPKNFKDSFIHDVVKYTQEILKPSQMTSHGYQKFYGMKAIGGNWDFIAPTFPQALFLDTRTKRYFEYFSDDEIKISDFKNIVAKGINKMIDFSLKKLKKTREEIKNHKEFVKQMSPRLINNEHFGILKNRFGTTLQDESFFLVTATPVFGIQRIEDFFRDGHPIFATEAVDNESWAANYNGYLALLNFLIKEIKPKQCIILSGDVHYGFINQCDVKISNATKAKFTQITSSSLKNNWKNVFKYLGGILEVLEENIEPFKKYEDIEWTENRTYLPVQHRNNKTSKIIANNNLGLLKYENESLGLQFLFLEKAKNGDDVKAGSSVMLVVDL